MTSHSLISDTDRQTDRQTHTHTHTQTHRVSFSQIIPAINTEMAIEEFV